VAFFSLEWTVGISWAVTLDIGGDFAGSVSAVMNTLGNIGGAISAAVVTYAARDYGWNAPFFVTCALCLIAAALFLKIDATKRVA
jgi:sugar phosphate permease